VRSSWDLVTTGRSESFKAERICHNFVPSQITPYLHFSAFLASIDAPNWCTGFPVWFYKD